MLSLTVFASAYETDYVPSEVSTDYDLEAESYLKPASEPESKLQAEVMPEMLLEGIGTRSGADAEVTGTVEGMLGHRFENQTLQIVLGNDTFTTEVVIGYDVNGWFVVTDFYAEPRSPAAMTASGFPGIRNFAATVTSVNAERNVATIAITGTPVIVNPAFDDVVIPADRLVDSAVSFDVYVDAGVLDIDVERNRGYTITINPDSPTGVYATFVYYNQDANRVQFRSEGRLLDTRNPPVPPPATTSGAPTLANNPFPEQFQEGMVPGAQFGGLMAWRAFERDMHDLGDGYFAITVPMTGGTTAYWYAVWGYVPGFTGVQSGRQIFDPYQAWTCPDFTTWSNRHHRGHSQSQVHVPWLPVQGIENYRPLELPHPDLEQRGTVVTHRYASPEWTHAYLGGAANPQNYHYVLVYLPVGYDTMTEPLPTIYVAHGNTNDAMDYMFTAGVKNILDNLIASGDLPPTVLVSINYQHFSGAVARRNAIMNYIIPSIEENFNVSTNPEHRGVGGFSIGGQIAAQLYQFNAGDFGYFAPLSTFGPPSAALLSAAPNNLFPTLFVGCGLWENVGNYRQLPINLTNAGIPFTHLEVHAGHDMHVIGRSMAYFLENVVTWEALAPTVVTPHVWFASGDVEVEVHMGAGRLEADGILSVTVGTTTLADTDWTLDGTTLIINEDVFEDYLQYNYAEVRIVFDTVAPEATTRVVIVEPAPAEPYRWYGTAPTRLQWLFEDESDIILATRGNLGIGAQHSPFTIPYGVTLTIETVLNISRDAWVVVEGTLIIPEGGRVNLQSNGSIRVAPTGVLTVEGTLESVASPNAHFVNDGLVTITDTGRVTVRAQVRHCLDDVGELVNNGSLTIHRDAVAFVRG